MALYSYRMTYRVDREDTRPAQELPTVISAAVATEGARDAAIVREGLALTAQGYRVERVDRLTYCGDCAGVGAHMVKPRGWRKRVAPPAWACQRQRCATCEGTGELTNEEVR